MVRMQQTVAKNSSDKDKPVKPMQKPLEAIAWMCGDIHGLNEDGE